MQRYKPAEGVIVLTPQSYETPKVGHSLTEKRNVEAAVLKEFLPEIVYRRTSLESFSMKSIPQVEV